MKKTRSSFLKIYAICVSIICLLAVIAFGLVFHRAGYDQKLLVKLGLAEPEIPTNFAVHGWNNTLMKLDYDADIVFFGDSLTADSDFGSFFPEHKIMTSGYYTDTLAGMISRVPGVAAVDPEKVFFLGGFNGLTDLNTDVCLQTYNKLLDELEAALPDAEIIIHSVLPVSSARETSQLHNTTIVDFNKRLSVIADERGLVFVDLYSVFEKNGELDPTLTRDGIHLLPEAYALWAEAISEYID